MTAKQIEIRFDQTTVRAFSNDVLQWKVEWKNLERIGYRSSSEGPWGEDYFLVLKTKDKPSLYFDIPLAWKGALELSKYIDKLPGTKCPSRGKLANCVSNTSVTVWPGEMSGSPIE